MCTLILKKPLHHDGHLQIFGNRDERLNRPATGFERIIIDKTVAWAPRDLEKGGTWLGVNEHGIFAGLTNRYAPEGYPDADLSASRGALPRRALALRTVSDAAAQIREMTQQKVYPGFHLLLSTSKETKLMVWNGRSLREEWLEQSLVVITERSFGDQKPAREIRLAKALTDSPHLLNLDDVTRVLSHHEPNSIDAVCVHLDGINYGTRTAVCITLAETLDGMEVWESQSPPCQARWQKVELDADRQNDT